MNSGQNTAKFEHDSNDEARQRLAMDGTMHQNSPGLLSRREPEQASFKRRQTPAASLGPDIQSSLLTQSLFPSAQLSQRLLLNRNPRSNLYSWL